MGAPWHGQKKAVPCQPNVQTGLLRAAVPPLLSCYRSSRRQRMATRERRRRPRCIVIAGPNGSGKTTFAREYLPRIARVVHFVNADLIAGGLSPLKPELAAIAAARMVLREIDRLASEREDFAFETTLSGRTYVRRMEVWKRVGYRIEIAYLRLSSPDLALRRIEARVRQGGHDVPKRDVIRRFDRGWENFLKIYQPMAESWAVYDNSGASPQLLERKK
jgi:predicted ABC-type ATPase